MTAESKTPRTETCFTCGAWEDEPCPRSSCDYVPHGKLSALRASIEAAGKEPVTRYDHHNNETPTGCLVFYDDYAEVVAKLAAVMGERDSTVGVPVGELLWLIETSELAVKNDPTYPQRHFWDGRGWNYDALKAARYPEKYAAEEIREKEKMYPLSSYPVCGHLFQCSASVTDELVDERKEEDELRMNLSAILTKTANALKGEPKPLHSHSWHDLPKIAEETKAALEIAEHLLEQERQRASQAESALATARAAERERCAKVCEDIIEVPHGDGSYTGLFRHYGNQKCAQSIRALTD